MVFQESHRLQRYMYIYIYEQWKKGPWLCLYWGWNTAQLPNSCKCNIFASKSWANHREDGTYQENWQITRMCTNCFPSNDTCWMQAFWWKAFGCMWSHRALSGEVPSERAHNQSFKAWGENQNSTLLAKLWLSAVACRFSTWWDP